MKRLLPLLLLLNTVANAQTDSLDVKKWKGGNKIFIEALGSGIFGSIGFSYFFYKKDNTFFNIDMGVGGIIKVKKKYRYNNSVIINLGFSIDKRLYKPIFITTGFTIASYNNIYKMKNIYKPEAYMIPRYNFYYMPFIGCTLIKDKFMISLIANKFYNYFAYNGIMPSVKLRIEI